MELLIVCAAALLASGLTLFSVRFSSTKSLVVSHAASISSYSLFR